MSKHDRNRMGSAAEQLFSKPAGTMLTVEDVPEDIQPVTMYADSTANTGDTNDTKDTNDTMYTENTKGGSTRQGLPEGWRRATIIVRETIMDRITDYAYWQRVPIKDVIDDILSGRLKLPEMDEIEVHKPRRK